MLPLITLSATIGVAPRDAGAAAGLLNSSRQLGGAIGLAILVNVAAAGGGTSLTARVHGDHVAFLMAGAITAAAALAALALPAG